LPWNNPIESNRHRCTGKSAFLGRAILSKLCKHTVFSDTDFGVEEHSRWDFGEVGFVGTRIRCRPVRRVSDLRIFPASAFNHLTPGQTRIELAAELENAQVILNQDSRDKFKVVLNKSIGT
jgi:hypothetical protein